MKGAKTYSKVGAVVEIGKLHGKSRVRFLDEFTQIDVSQGVAGLKVDVNPFWSRRNARSQGMAQPWRV